MNTEDLISTLFAINAVKFGQFTLKSGATSPIYIDCRQTISHPTLLKSVASLLWQKTAIHQPDLVCGVPYTALPIATCLSVAEDIPMVMRRKEKKDYGTKQLIEGTFQPGQTCLVIEDVITTGTSVLDTAKDLQDAGLLVKDIAVLLDREQGGREQLQARGFRVHAVVTMTLVLQTLLSKKLISQDCHEEVTTFLKGSVAHV